MVIFGCQTGRSLRRHSEKAGVAYTAVGRLPPTRAESGDFAQLLLYYFMEDWGQQGDLNIFHNFDFKDWCMTYITIDTKTKQAQKFVELIETMPFARILKEPNATTKKAIDDARKGKTTKADSLDQLFADLKK
jgi:hypothetical protein